MHHDNHPHAFGSNLFDAMRYQAGITSNNAQPPDCDKWRRSLVAIAAKRQSIGDAAGMREVCLPEADELYAAS